MFKTSIRTLTIFLSIMFNISTVIYHESTCHYPLLYKVTVFNKNFIHLKRITPELSRS